MLTNKSNAFRKILNNLRSQIKQSLNANNSDTFIRYFHFFSFKILATRWIVRFNCFFNISMLFSKGLFNMLLNKIIHKMLYLCTHVTCGFLRVLETIIHPGRKSVWRCFFPSSSVWWDELRGHIPKTPPKFITEYHTAKSLLDETGSVGNRFCPTL